MHETNYQSAIRAVLDNALKITGLDKREFYTILEEGHSDIKVKELTKVRFVLEVKKTRNEVVKTKWWKRTREEAVDAGACYFGVTNGETLILFRNREGAKVGSCMVKPGLITLGEYGPDGEADTVLDSLGGEMARIFTQLFVDKRDLEYERSLSALLDEYRTAHKALTAELKRGLVGKHRSDHAFRKAFFEWTSSFSNTPKDRSNFNIAAEECGHVVLNRVVFYEILRNELKGLDDSIKRERGIPRVELLPLEDLASQSMSGFLSELSSRYALILKVNYEQVFSTTGNVLDQIPFNQNAVRIVQSFIEDLESFSLTRDEFGEPAQLFSCMFEELIPYEKRHDYGQVFTDKRLVDILCTLCVRDKDVVVLDPACGTGSFLDAAYDRIWQLSQHAGAPKTHPEVLSNLHGVEISKFPIHLCAMRLTLKDTTYSTNADLKEASFFNVTPEMVGGVDVILCNPPYLRQEVIPRTEKTHIRSTIKATLGNKYPYSPLKADKYFYFVEYATSFLRKSGYAGWVLSDKLLVNISGRKLKRFLLDHYRIKAVIKFGRRSFPKFMVDNCLLYLEMPEDKRDLSGNQTVFLKVKQPMSTEEIEQAIMTGQDSSNDVRRIVIVSQDRLDPTKRWTEYFADLSILAFIKKSTMVVPLPQLCDRIDRGKDNGCSEFFFPYKYTDEFDIEDFLVDGLEGSRDIDTLILRSKDCEEFLLIPPSTDLAARKNLGLKQFIKFASSRGFDPEYRHRRTRRYLRVPCRPTVRANARRSHGPWYSFDPGRNDYDIIIPRMVRTYFKVLVSEARPYLSTNFWGIILKRSSKLKRENELDKYFIGAFLNSSLGELQFEDKARNYVGLAKMEKPDISELVVIDPRNIPKQKKALVKEIFEKMSKNFRSKECATYKEKLDLELLSILGMPKMYNDLTETLEELKQSRKYSGLA